MNRDLDRLVDNGCWISDDRVYAFIAAGGLVSEVGYHGTQPVSRNSRILVQPRGVLRFCVRMTGGDECKLSFSAVDWQPGAISADLEIPGGSVNLRLRTSGRSLQVLWSGSGSQGCAYRVRLSKASPFTDVHGVRTWLTPAVERNSLTLCLHDRISLQAWLSRTGPYAGDFLIPESLRRELFMTRKRSGRATREDLRPEYRETDLLIYDAAVYLRCEGEGFELLEDGDDWLFDFGVHDSGSSAACFHVRFADRLDDLDAGLNASSPSATEQGSPHEPAQLKLEGYPHWQEFYATVPPLVDSCIVKDYGVPRACPGRYYWIWAWDMLVTAGEALRWGDTELARETIRFVNSHRDADGVIPARWTRSLDPLDTPSPGGIEFLFVSLAYETFLESGRTGDLLIAYPAVLSRLVQVAPQLKGEGVVRGDGFYPDLPRELGRQDDSVVAMETGSWYALCRIVQNMARFIGDRVAERLAAECAASVARSFSERFWDDAHGFWSDLDRTLNAPPRTIHPLFALLFMHSPLGLSLIRDHIGDAAGFIAQRLATQSGMRTIPIDEAGDGVEAVLDAWYPYWDVHALSILRRAGDAGSIVSWLNVSESALGRLGYCPEFLSLRKFREGRPGAWAEHGAASNLNCVTAWHRAIRQSVCGMEFDPGGMTHIPLSLPLGRVGIDGVCWRGGRWTVEVDYQGPRMRAMSVDGLPVIGCLKVPSRFAGPGDHLVEVHYGDQEAPLRFEELINAAVATIEAREDSVEVEVEVLGYLEGSFFSAGLPALWIDGRQIESVWDPASRKGRFSAELEGTHVLRLTSM